MIDLFEDVKETKYLSIVFVFTDLIELLNCINILINGRDHQT
jgi:hypothetical protein